MKKSLQLILIFLSFFIILNLLLPKRYKTKINTKSFFQLPVQIDGRIKPISTVASNAFSIISGSQKININNQIFNPYNWFLEVIFRADVADNISVFKINNNQILTLLNLEKFNKYFSFNDLKPHFNLINKYVKEINPENQLHSNFEKSIIQLYDSLTLYHELIHSFRLLGFLAENINQEYYIWLKNINLGIYSIQKQKENKIYDKISINNFIATADHYLELAKLLKLYIIPPSKLTHINMKNWSNLGEELINSINTNQIHPIIRHYADLATSYNNYDSFLFQKTLKKIYYEYNNTLINSFRVNCEDFFNYFKPFYKGIILYLYVICLVCFSWIIWSNFFKKIAFFILVIALLIHSFGIGIRMYIQMRPPVTNLYSSAIFVGWVAVFLGCFIEYFLKNGTGSVISSVIGIITLLIAHQIGVAGGDTLEMLRAVLDSNFWLSTHVILITIGYASLFFAGTLGIFYLLGGITTTLLNKRISKSLQKIVYGILCFSMLFSFIGTMLGGIWADQSWGRFWGWDPKENGAILIVLWIAIILHAKWSKLIEARGLMLLSVFANIITSWSWFGTNMLGIGLHSYGFMNQAFWYLFLFIMSQFTVICLGCLPIKYWRSYKKLKS